MWLVPENIPRLDIQYVQEVLTHFIIYVVHYIGQDFLNIQHVHDISTKETYSLRIPFFFIPHLINIIGRNILMCTFIYFFKSSVLSKLSTGLSLDLLSCSLIIYLTTYLLVSFNVLMFIVLMYTECHTYSMSNFHICRSTNMGYKIWDTK